MFDWIRRLLAGDQSSPPAGVEVVRDRLGRIVEARGTLTSGEATAGSRDPPLQLTPEALPALKAAAAWLHGQNMRAAQGWGVGMETDFGYDQDEAVLTLHGIAGAQPALKAQILGSFDPHDRSFMWAWHNPSISPEVCAMARAAREQGESDADPAFTTPVMTAKFDDLALVIALAAQKGGADGVYRAVLDNATSVFLAFQLEEGTRLLEPVAPELAAAVTALIEGYDRDQLEQDRRYREGAETGSADLDAVIRAKMVAYERDWARDDEYWRPASAGWPSDHDRASNRVHFLARHPEGGVLDVGIKPGVRQTVYRIEEKAGGVKITDQLIDWGRGFVWP